MFNSSSCSTSKVLSSTSKLAFKYIFLSKVLKKSKKIFERIVDEIFKGTAELTEKLSKEVPNKLSKELLVEFPNKLQKKNKIFC